MSQVLAKNKTKNQTRKKKKKRSCLNNNPSKLGDQTCNWPSAAVDHLESDIVQNE